MGARRQRSSAVALAAVLLATTAGAAYFHESKRDGMTWLSDPGLKRGFVVQQPVAASMLSSADGAQIVAAAPAAGLFEAPNGPRIPQGRCEGDEEKLHRCERQWEATNLPKGKGVVSRKSSTLTLAPKAGAKLDLADWEKCSPEGECDGERFTYLGPLGRGGVYHAVEIDYQHDSPSLLLFDPSDGKIVAVHYGSEPTLLNAAENLLVTSEDLNDATTLLVTRLGTEAPEIELQCLGARTESSSFGVTFKRWSSDSNFEVVLLKAGQTIPVRFERSADGAWSARSPAALKSEGFECRQRGPTTKPAAPVSATPPRAS